MNEIKKLSIGELKEELSNCRPESVKFMIISSRIKDMELALNKSRNKRVKATNKVNRKSTKEVKNKKPQKPNRVAAPKSSLFDSLNDLIEEHAEPNIGDYFSDGDFEDSEVEEVEDPINDPFTDKKFAVEIQKDVLNKHMMERMNSERFVRENTDRRHKKNFIAPFADDDDGVHASINKMTGVKGGFTHGYR